MKYICNTCNRETDWEFCPYCATPTSIHGITPTPAEIALSRRKRVRVWTWLILGAIVFFGVRWLIVRPHRDDEAVNIINSAGGRVTRESRIPVVACCLDANIFSYGAVFHVDCSHIRIDAQVIQAISSLPDLDTWFCFDCIFEPDCLKHLQPIPRLRVLSLIGTSVGDSDLVHLRSLENLELLILTNTHVTDEGIVHFAALQKLRVVNLGGTKVTPAGRDHLKSLLPNVKIRD